MSGVILRRPARRHTLISVVSMIDVMMILLFFFMVTSSYLNLDMVPALQKSDEAPDDTPVPSPSTKPGSPATLLIRIGADGAASVRGQPLANDALIALLRARLATDPLTPVVLFPSGGAQLQALITVMDTVTKAGAVRVKVIRLGAAK